MTIVSRRAATPAAPAAGGKISVLLVDDHPLVRGGFRRLLEDDPDITVVGEANDGEAAVRLAASLKPRVVVMDYAMPGTSGLSATRRILEELPDAAILMVSMHSEEILVRRALQAGARGYVLKDACELDLAKTVKQVACGQTVLDDKLSWAAVESGPQTQGLTTRQLEVLQLICEGLSNHGIAAKLGLSANTIAVHRSNIMRTLGIHRVSLLVAYAVRHRLVSMP